MKNQFVVVPYKKGSSGARELAEALDCYRVSPDSPTFKLRPHHIPIFWGTKELPRWCRPQPNGVINHPNVINRACNKLVTFQILQNIVPIPDWTQSSEIARSWLRAGCVVVERHSLTGQGGAGIVVREAEDTISNALLYTKHLRHRDEYRVHVIRDKVIHVQQKKRRNGEPDGKHYVRNLDNGYVFCIDGVNPPEVVKEVARAAVTSLGLDFGAVDIGYRAREDKAYVFEVNTAPGLEGTTVTKYAEGFKQYL